MLIERMAGAPRSGNFEMTPVNETPVHKVVGKSFRGKKTGVRLPVMAAGMRTKPANRRCGCDKARAQLGWMPRPI
ncbi:hypothetical protein IVB38_34710 [Bradyrhizobium sp. 38]|nr:hypothetical protein [Bradyrhizobium sp. 38]